MYPKYCNNEVTFQQLVERKIVSKALAKKAAASGLCFKHLCLAVQRNGIDGLRSLFSQRNKRGDIRVTSSNRIIQRVYDFI